MGEWCYEGRGSHILIRACVRNATNITDGPEGIILIYFNSRMCEDCNGTRWLLTAAKGISIHACARIAI